MSKSLRSGQPNGRNQPESGYSELPLSFTHSHFLPFTAACAFNCFQVSHWSGGRIIYFMTAALSADNFPSKYR
ncbi:hypothetical protein ACFY2D_20595 [Streptomyces nigra]|uniref:hypothetical protein n=1 Tax=Streptomyces nigra TaxID=1827580 RepID=UPI00367C7C49